MRWSGERGKMILAAAAAGDCSDVVVGCGEPEALGIKGFLVLWSAFAIEAGRVDTVCWSSTQQGTFGSVLMMKLVWGAKTESGCACDATALRRPASTVSTVTPGLEVIISSAFPFRRKQMRSSNALSDTPSCV